MYSVDDFYTKFAKTNANVDCIALNLPNEGEFPEGYYIGEFESMTGCKVPALLPINRMKGLIFLTHDANIDIIHHLMQTLAIRFLLTIPTRLCKLTLYDSVGIGQNLIALAKVKPEIKGGELILTEPNELRETLIAAEKDIKYRIQQVLGVSYRNKTIVDYNREKTGIERQQYHFFFITDFPNSLFHERGIVEKLKYVIENGSRVGFYVVMSIDTTYNVKEKGRDAEFDWKSFLELSTVIYESKGRYYIKNLPELDVYKDTLSMQIKDGYPDVDMIEKIVSKINKDYEGEGIGSVQYIDELTEDNLWKCNSDGGVRVPIGKKRNGDYHYFELSDRPVHCLVCGATGSGKSVLLHNVISNTAWLYSPQDVQFVLLDYKQGIEFVRYKELPHVKVLDTQNDKDFGERVCKFLESIFNERSRVFKENGGLSSIQEYNQKNPEKKLPRLIVIIDEFQIILKGIQKHMMLLLQQGRSYGIHLILSTQTVKGMSLNNILSHIDLKISFKLNTEEDCFSLLDYGNKEPYTELSGPGDAIYNAGNGLKKNNKRFQCFLLKSEDICRIVGVLKKRYASLSLGKPVMRFINDKSEYATFNDIPKGVVNDGVCKVYVGQPLDLVETHAYYTIRNRENSNVLVVGGDVDSANSIIKHSLEQIDYQSSENGWFVVAGEIGEIHSLELDKVSGKIQIRDDVGSVVQEIAEKMVEKENERNGTGRTVLVLYNITAEIIDDCDVFFKDLLENGYIYNVHLIVFAKSVSEIRRTNREKFDVIIALNGSDVSKVFGESSVGSWERKDNVFSGSHVAKMKAVNTGNIQEFKVYSL